MIVREHMGFDDIDDWEVVGPQGELYGRYKTRPTAEQVPLYALVKETKGFTLGAAGKFSGQVQVVDPSGRPVSNLTVTFNESPGRDIVGAGQARAFTDSKGIATFINVDVLSPENGVYEIEGRGILKKVVRAVPGQMAKTEVMVLI